MRAASLAVLLLLSHIFAVVAARPVDGDTGVGSLPTLAPEQAPPLLKPGPLADPRSSDQVGFPRILTNYVISPATLTPARVALGQKLFFEPRLSADGTVACATCHDPARAFTDGRPVSVGIHGRLGQPNSPTVLNALYNKTQFWERPGQFARGAGGPADHEFVRDGLGQHQRCGVQDRRRQELSGPIYGSLQTACERTRSVAGHRSLSTDPGFIRFHGPRVGLPLECANSGREQMRRKFLT